MPAWMTPELLPVCPVAICAAASSTATRRSDRRSTSSRATASPTIPAPTTTRSQRSGATTAPLAGLPPRPAPWEQLDVRVSHHARHLLEARARHPAELLARLGRVADQVLDLGRAQEARIDPDVMLGGEPRVLEGDLHELTH